MKLDLKDRKILAELEMNARAPHSEIAKKVRLSKQVVKYRIDHLEKDELIQGYNALIDLNKLGQTIYVIYLKLIKMSSAQESKWLEELNNILGVLAAGRNSGYWDLTIAISCKNNQELDVLYNQLIRGKAEHIKEKLITSEVESTYFNTDILLKGTKTEFSTSKIQEQLKIDEKDQKLINELAKDCRKSLLELGDKLKLSPNGVKDKIRRLEEKKIIIGYKTKINYEKLEYLHFRVFLHLAKFTPQLYDSVKGFLKTRGNIESISHYLGYADVDFRCYCKGIVELYNLTTSLKDAFLNEIIEIDSMPIFSWKKIRYASRT